MKVIFMSTLRQLRYLDKKYGTIHASMIPTDTEEPVFSNDVDFDPKHDIMCHDMAPTSSNATTGSDVDQSGDACADEPDYVVGSGVPDDFDGVPNAVDVMADYECPQPIVHRPAFVWPGTSPELPEPIPMDRNYVFTGRRNYVSPW